MYIQQLLSEARVVHALAVTSKAQLLEGLGQLLQAGAERLDAASVLAALTARERLGSTGLGDGVALPHGRVPGLARPIGAFATLDHPLEYDAIDHKPVTMAFVLLVPDNATDEHLRILSELAGLFSNRTWRRGLLEAKDRHELYRRLTQFDDTARTHDPHAHHSRSV
mgnify:CR=1 FL=1